ncbi:MAG: DNA recombination protein RmuC [Pseudomonadota bacterium]|nr:DNA recombination protein RmuC [Pseudomonadota bacterium]
MSETLVYTALGIIGIIATALGYTLSALRSRIQLDNMREKYVSLNERLDQQRTETTEKFSSVERVKHGLEQTLSSFTPPDLSLSNKEKFTQAMLQPLQETLKSADIQVKRIKREGEKAQQLIDKQLALLQAPEQLGRGNPKAVTATLGDSEARRQWGLTTLKALLELTYMTDHYRICKNKEGEPEKEDKYFPPCLIQMLDNQQIAIDINTPLEAYVNVCHAPDSSVRSWHQESHARKLRERIMTISSRAYLSRFEEPPALTIQLILNDHYLTTAMEIDSDLVQLATSQRIILATPSDLLTLLQAISFSWQQQLFSKDAHKLRETGIQLYRHFGTFIKLIAELGSELSGVVDSYKRAVNYFETDASKPPAAAPDAETPTSASATEKKSA